MLMLFLLCVCVLALGIAGGWFGWHWLFLLAVVSVAAPLTGVILTNMHLGLEGNAAALLAVFAATLIGFGVGRQLARTYGQATT